MAIIPVHRRITETVLKEQGFSDGAVEIAADANAAVDDKQGNQSAEANLHAMRGYLGGQMQTEDQTPRQAVAGLLDAARQDILDAISRKDYAAALRRMGETLHTVQDGAIHHFEPWPYTGIGSAIWHNPGYMLMHGARHDLCLTRYLVAGWASLDQGRWGVATEVGFSTYFSARWFPDSVGLRGNYLDGGGRSREVSGMLTLCWGACPGTGASPTNSRSAPPGALGGPNRGPVFQPEWSYELKIRPEVLQDAEDKSRQFVESVKTAAGALWDEFAKT